MVLIEDYPNLKADENFLIYRKAYLKLKTPFSMLEGVNGSVRDLNNLIETFPSSIVARIFRFQKAEFFEIQDAKERKVPKSY